MGCLAAYAAGSGSFIATEPNNPRKLSATTLCKAFQQLGCECIEAPDPLDAFALAKERAKEFDAVLFTGSLYMIGEIRKVLSHDDQINDN